MKFAAIDIGSNAIRLQVTTVLNASSGIYFKKLEYVRFPMRLGEDVFNLGKLSTRQKNRFIKLMKAFKILLDLYEVDDYMVCATSALREAKNGREIIEIVKKETGLEIVIIEGETEAKMINDALTDYLDNGEYLHIDVGGGSTELNLYSKGNIITSASFRLGSVRSLQKKEIDQEWQLLRAWLKNNSKTIIGKITAIGTGGNINKLFELAKKLPGEELSLPKLIKIQKTVDNMSMEDRIIELQLNPDRADVIIPASKIYISVMKWAKCNAILVPNVGLKDGMMIELYNRRKKVKR